MTRQKLFLTKNMRVFIKFVLGLLLAFFSAGMLYSLYVSTSFRELVNNIKPLSIALFQVVMFCFGLLAMFRQRVVSFLAIILLLIVEAIFIGYVAQSIAESINTLVK